MLEYFRNVLKLNHLFQGTNMTLSDIVMDRPETKKVVNLLPHLPAVFEFGLIYVLTGNPNQASDISMIL